MKALSCVLTLGLVAGAAFAAGTGSVTVKGSLTAQRSVGVGGKTEQQL